MAPYHYRDLGRLSAGTPVRVTLSGTAANVFLISRTDFRSYTTGGKFKVYGGYYRRSPVMLYPPKDGNWVVVVDYGGGTGPRPRSVEVASTS